MDQSFLTKKQNIKQESRKHNYAPNMVPNQGTTTTTALFNKRQAAAAAVYKQKQDLTADLRQRAMAANVNLIEKKKKARDYYAERQVVIRSRYKSMEEVPANISPLLDMRQKMSLCILERISKYNKNHKCKHNRAYTGYTMHNNVFLDGTLEPLYIELKCYCTLELLTNRMSDRCCINCTKTQVREVLDDTIACEIYFCDFCRRTQYVTIGATLMRPIIYTRLKNKPTVKEFTTKTWNALPQFYPQQDDGDLTEGEKAKLLTDFPTIKATPEAGRTLSEKEIADAMRRKNEKRQIINALDYLSESDGDEFHMSKTPEQFAKAMNNAAKEKVDVKKEAQADNACQPDTTWITTLKSLWDKMIDMAVNCKNMICKWVEAKVVNKVKDVAFAKVISLAWDNVIAFLRHIGIAIINRPVTYGMLMWQFFNTHNSIQRSLLLMAFLEEEHLKLMWTKTLLGLGVDVRLPKPYDFDRDKCKCGNEHCEHGNVRYAKVTPEFGLSSFLEPLFGLTKMLGPNLAMSLIKDFNAMFTGWRNVHELVMQFFDRLPNWITKFFSISDPRKRFGHDSQTPGNPVYTMVQTYLKLLTGDNFGSAHVYKEFAKAWQDAEVYICKEYVPNQAVTTMLQSYWKNAASIVRPVTHGSKPIPFVLTLRGDPGTGKSSSWPALLAKILGGTIEEIKAMSYTRNSSSEYFDGYNPQKHKIFVYDDFGSQVDDKAAGELMSIVSGADYLPPFAGLSDHTVGIKGTSFDSPIVVLLTNFSNFNHIHQQASSTALARRLGYVIDWSHQYKPGFRYNLYSTNFKGTQDLLPNPNGDIFGDKDEYGKITNEQRETGYKMHELQDKLAELYKKHFEDQINVDIELNRTANLTPAYDFLKCYNDVRAKVVKAKQQTGVFSLFTIVAATHAWAEFTSQNQVFWKDAVLAVAGAFALAWLGLKLMYGADAESGEVATRSRMPTKQFLRPVVVRTEAGQQNDDGIINKVLRNQVFLVNEDSYCVNGLFICGRIMITVKHFINSSKQLFIYTHRATDEAVYEIHVDKCKKISVEGADLILIEMPDHIQPYINITSMLPSQVFSKDTAGYVVRRNSAMEIFIRETNIKKTHLILDYERDDMRPTVCHIAYNCPHQAGDCGNPVMAHEGGSLKIIGLHNSGSPDNANMSFAMALNKGEILKLLVQFAGTSKISREADMPHEKAKLQLGYREGINKAQFVLESTNHIMSSGKTELVESDIFDKVHEHTMVPALLRKTGDIDPMQKALNKYGLSTKQFDENLTEMAIDALIEELIPLKTSEDIDRELTLHECLNGIPGQVDSVDLSTSSGYPFSLDPKTRGPKRLVIDGEPGNLSLNSAAQQHYDEWDLKIKSGIVPSDPFLATLKDEKRKIEKVKLGKTRVFCAGSITSFMHNKRCFGGFNTFFKRTRASTFSTLGMNRASMEWHAIITNFKSVSDVGLDGDQEEWDGRFKAGIAIKLARFFDAYYKNKNVERLVLIMHAVFPYLRITWPFEKDLETVVLEIPGCMPSGWYLTFVVNSLVNAVLMRIAWLSLVSSPFNDLIYFRQYVREKYAGDDNFLAVSRGFVEQFNNITIAKLFLEHQQKYTPASKSGELLPYQKIESCTFLKTKTGYRYDRFVPLFDMDANLDTMNWIRKCDDHHAATEDNINDVLRNLFFYGEDVFKSYRAKVLQHGTYNLISYYPLKMAYLGFGFISDPHGSFGYTRTVVSNPLAFKKALEKAIDFSTQYNNLKVAVVTEMGRHDNMNTDKQIKCLENEVTQANYSIQLQVARIDKLKKELQTLREKHLESASRIKCIENEVKQAEHSVDLQIKRCEVLRKDLAALRQEQKCLKCNYCDLDMCTSDDMLRHLNSQEHAAKVGATKIRANPESGPSHKSVDGMTVEQPEEDVAVAVNVEGTQSSIDDATPQITTNVGVTLSEQQQTVVRKAADGAIKPSMSRAQAHLNEIDWDLQKMLLRENLVGAFPWSLTDAVGTELPIVGGISMLDVPSDLLQNALVSAPFIRFQWWRCEKIKVRFQLVASRFHQGRLGIYYLPTMIPRNNIVAGQKFTPTRWTQLQHAFLDPANGTIIDMEIPFRYHKGWIDLVFGDALGQLHCQVLNPLQAATGASNSVEVKVYVSFEGSHFRVPRPSNGTFKDALEKEANTLGYTLVRARKEAGVFQGIGGGIGKELDKIVESVLPAEVTGAVAGILMDKPAVTEYPPPLTTKDAQYMSASRGIENLERMTLEPSAQYITTDQFGDTVDETDLKYLLKKPVYLTTVNWSATQNVGDILYSTIVSPAHLIAGKVPVAGTYFEPTPIGFLSNMFTYWRGGINFFFQIVGTTFHEGRLDFCNHPATTTVPADYVTAMSQYVNSQTVRNTNNTIEVKVPFHSDIPWKRVWNGERLSDTLTDNAFRSMDFVTGIFDVRISVPLKSPNNVANNVDINIFVCGADDFELHTLSIIGGIYDLQQFSRKKKQKAALESGRTKATKSAGNNNDLNLDDKTDNNVVSLGIGDVLTYDPKIHHFGETYSNLREMCKRYQTVSTAAGTLGVGNNSVRFYFYGQVIGGIMSVLFSSYRLFRGPMNFKIQTFAKSSNGANNYATKITGFCTNNPQPTLSTGSAASGTVAIGYANRPASYLLPPIVRFSDSQVGEFQIPFQSIYHSLLNYQTFDDVPDYFSNAFSQWDIICNLFNGFTDDTTIRTYTTLATAFADETRVGVFIGFPPITKKTTIFFPNPGS